MSAKRKLCTYAAPYEYVPCTALAEIRISYRDDSHSHRFPLVIPERDLCKRHAGLLRRGVERNYGTQGTWTEVALPEPKTRKRKAKTA